jgi:hypothetical protein
MQCKPVAALPLGKKWSFEIKFDGYRSIAVKRRREVTLFSRHEKVLNRRFSSVVEALASDGFVPRVRDEFSRFSKRSELPTARSQTCLRKGPRGGANR